MSYDAIRRSSVGGRLRFLLRDSVLYGAASALSKGFTILLVPLLTRVLSRGEYGLVDVLAVLASVAVMVAMLGQDSAVARFFYDTEDPEEQRQIVSQALAAQLLWAVLVAAMLAAVAPVVARRVLGVGEASWLVWIVAATVPLLVVHQSMQNLLKWTFARRAFVVVSVGFPVSVVALTAVGVLVLGMRIEGVLYAQLAAAGVFALAGAWLARAYLAVPAGWAHLPPMLRFGLPFLAVGLSAVLVPAVDRYFVTRFLGLEATGVYAVGYKLAFLLSMPILAFQTAWSPMSYAIFREPDAKATFDRVLTWLVAGLSVAAVGLSLAAAPAIAFAASPAYAAGAVVVLPLAFALVLEAASLVAGAGIVFSKRSHLSALSYGMGLAATAGAVAVLVPRLGIAGAAYGVLAGKAVQGASYVALGYRAYPLRLHLGTPAAIVAGSFAAALLLRHAASGALAAGVLLAVAAAGIALAVLYVQGGGRPAPVASAMPGPRPATRELRS